MEIYLITDTRARYGCGGPDMRFVLSDVDYALMEYYRYASRILRNGRVRDRKILCAERRIRVRVKRIFFSSGPRVIKGEKLDSDSERYLFDPPAIWISARLCLAG